MRQIEMFICTFSIHICHFSVVIYTQEVYNRCIRHFWFFPLNVMIFLKLLVFKLPLFILPVRAPNIWKDRVSMLVQNHLILQITDYLLSLTALMETLSNVQPKQLLAWNAQLAAPVSLRHSTNAETDTSLGGACSHLTMCHPKTGFTEWVIHGPERDPGHAGPLWAYCHCKLANRTKCWGHDKELWNSSAILFG